MFAFENFEPAQKLRALLVKRNSGELTVVVQADHSGVAIHVSMLISVESDGPSTCLPPADYIPEFLVALAFVKSRIDVVRHDRQDRADILVDHDLLQLLPERPIDSRAHI